MTQRVILAALLLALAAWPAVAQAPVQGALSMYVIDVEGGHAVLYVSPTGQSMLVDTGYAGFDARDAGRVVAAAMRAGVKQIDYLVITHYHGDHVGGATELAARMPIRNFVDHGPTSEQGDRAAAYQEYLKVRAGGTHIEVKPGDRIPISGLDVRVVASDGNLLSVPLEGGGIPNPLCATFTPMRDERSDDAHSVGEVITYGKFRTINLGDLSWNQEFGLVCPTNRLGTVDVLLASQHGDDDAGSATFVHALRPRVGILNNGPKKGAIQPIVQTMRISPGLQDIWQLHSSLLGNRLNVSDEFIANVGEDADTGHWLLVTAHADGSFSMTNGRTGFTKTYPVAAAK